jgi:hypothetical protein
LFSGNENQPEKLRLAVSRRKYLRQKPAEQTSADKKYQQ